MLFRSIISFDASVGNDKSFVDYYFRSEDYPHLAAHEHQHEGDSDPHSHDAIRDAAGPNSIVAQHSHDEVMHRGEDVEAQKLAKQVRVLCWILTTPKNHKKKAIHIKRTWGSRCNKLIFMSSVAGKFAVTRAFISSLN